MRSNAVKRDRMRPAADLQGSRHFHDLVDFELIALFDLVVVLQRQAALESCLDFAHVILEALERIELAVEDDDAVTQQPDLRAAADHALEDVATGYRADLGNLVDLAHFDEPKLALL